MSTTQVVLNRNEMTFVRSFLVCCAGLLLTQGLVDISLRIGQILKDRYYQYEVVFLPISAALLAVSFHRSNGIKKLKTPIFISLGVFFGYFSGFVSFYVLPIFAVGGLERLWQPPRNGEEWITLAWSPLIILSWLVGGFSSALVLVLTRKFPNRVIQVSAAIAILGLLLLTQRFSLLGHVLHGRR